LNEASAQFIFDLVSTRKLLQVYLIKLCIERKKKKEENEEFMLSFESQHQTK